MGPSNMGTPITAITRPTRCGPAARVRIVIPTGMSMPPPSPCNTRNVINTVEFHANPESTEPPTNNTIEIRYSRLVPNRSAPSRSTG